MIAITPAAWNADARSRSQTRGLLTALSRERKHYFVQAPLKATLWAVLSLGVLPLLLYHGRLRRWARQEDTQWRALDEWARTFHGKCILTPLERDEDDSFEWDDGEHPSFLVHAFAPRRPPITLGLTLGLVVIGLASASFDARPISALVHDRSSLLRVAWMLASVVITIAWNRLSMTAGDVFTILDYRLVGLNAALSVEHRRPIKLPTRRRWNLVTALMTLGIVVAIFYPWPIWLIVIPLYVWTWNRSVALSRQVNLQLIERLLEWMDDSGVPMEFDVVALNPDEIAVMIG